MNITDETKTVLIEHLKTVENLRSFLKSLWVLIREKQMTTESALELLDTMSDIEIDGACRGPIMDILDRASMSVGGRVPTLSTEEYEERKILLPPQDKQILSSNDDRPKSNNIIQLFNTNRK